MKSTAFAHSRPRGDRRPWQELLAHLRETGEAAAGFAPVPLQGLARQAGSWHDFGKYQPAFQAYLGVSPEASTEETGAAQSVPHSAAGAALALEQFAEDDPRGRALACVIEAHHGSLKAASQIESVVAERGRPLLIRARSGTVPASLQLPDASLPELPLWCFTALGIRMLFSALVDADLLNTEAWDRGLERARPEDDLTVLADRLELACRQLPVGSGNTSLSDMRREVLEACILAAKEPSGSFTLTVPTGGGKTLSGLAFALRHAVIRSKKRVIVVAPYTSILEQTAEVYRKVLGAENVIEHHSNLDPQLETDRNRQACENWDAPVIVTTSVQFFESLYAAHKRPCRKLHRIAESVVVLDEVQTFPPGLLQPIHSVLKQLIDHFGMTVVHSTATQPLLASAKSVLPKRLQSEWRQIVPKFATHFGVVADRFTLHRVGDLQVPCTQDKLAAEIKRHPTALTIVHNRKEARDLASALGADCHHLSALMCAEHRSSVLRRIRERLKAHAPCRVVATQLIEAGVDIDFPVVFRALAGLETLAQAAGRCNRELKAKPGQFFVFRAPSDPPKGSLSLGMRVALDSYFRKGDPDLNDPHLFPRYAREVLSMQETDAQRVMEPEEQCDFPTVAERFRMIDDAGVSVIAPFGTAADHLAALRKAGPSRAGFRTLQRFTVSLHAQEFERLFQAGYLERVLGGEPETAAERTKTLWCVRDGMATQVYDERFGFGGTDALPVLMST